MTNSPDKPASSSTIATTLGNPLDELPTLLFPTTAANNEISQLVRQIVNSIAHYTDYQIVVGIILAQNALSQPQLVICSPLVPPLVTLLLHDHPLTTKETKEIIESGIGIT